MEGGGEDRLIEHVFPIASELLLGHDFGQHLVATTVDDRADIAPPGGIRAAEAQGRQVEVTKGLHQPKTGLLVVSDHMRRDYPLIMSGQPDFFGFGDEIADGEDQAIIVDHRTTAFADGAERCGGERRIGDMRA